MIVYLSLLVAGSNTGPFDLYSDVDGFLLPFEQGVSKSSLLAGYISNIVPDTATTVQIKSTSVECSVFVNLSILSSTTTTTTTTIPAYAYISCDTGFNYSGGAAWGVVISINTGPAIGEICIPTSTGNVPDRFIIREEGVVVFDTGFQGGSMYDFGGVSRNSFKGWVVGKVDPITNIAYPDLVNFPDDGYPRVNGIINDLNTFNKTTSTSTLYMYVYGSGPGTQWAFALGCPGSGTYCPASTTTTTTLDPVTTTTTSTEIPSTTTTTTV